MTDRYNSFSELAKDYSRGRDFCVRMRRRPGTTAIIAPHGGGIEPGTSELALAIAGDDLSFYVFEGTKSINNKDLHITSTRFDEPACVRLVETSPRAISIHGEASQQPVVYLGGLDTTILTRLRGSLEAKRFTVETHESILLQARSRSNICNRCERGRGVQLELSHELRRSFFRSLSKTGRQVTTEQFERFVAAVREIPL